MLSKKRLSDEIEAVKGTIEKLKNLIKDVEINEIVLKAFEEKLSEI